MIAAVLGLAVLIPPPAPDLIPSGWKGVRLHLTVEAGDGVRGLCFAHRVAEGETLAQIAELRLGDAARADEIAAMNAGVDAEHLEERRLLWLPPAVPPRPAELQRLVYVDMGRAAQGSSPSPFAPGDASAAVTRNGELVLFLVPIPRADAFARACAERRGPGDRRPSELTRMVEAGDVTVVRCPIESAYVRDEEPVARRTDVFRIDRDPETGAMTLVRRSSQAFDAAGERLEAGAGGDGAERKKQALLPLSLAGIGLAGLWGLARRRRPEVAAGVA